MEQKKEIAYQMELFDINGHCVIYPILAVQTQKQRTDKGFGRQTGTILSVWINGAGMQSE